MPTRCDLHMHSTFSDGSFSPEELVVYAKAKRLSAIALTDHHTARGLPSFFQAARRHGIIPVAGTEMSAAYQGHEVHILGLFLPVNCWNAIDVWMAAQKREKEQSNCLLAQRLTKAGYPIDYAAIQQQFPDSAINRAHFATVLVEKGYCVSTDEAFATFLHPANGFYTPAPFAPAMDVIARLASFGGLVALAHPITHLSWTQLPGFIKQAVRAGMTAMETHHSDFTPSDIARLQAMCSQYGLLECGGSDFHGTRKPDVEMGDGGGGTPIPFAMYQALSQAAAMRTSP